MITSRPVGRRRFLTGLFGGALSLAALPMQAARLQPTILIQRSPLAGFQFHHGAAVWQQLHVGGPLTLIREPDNLHDDRAVRVDWHRQQLGYVPRRENTVVAQMLDRGERLHASIVRLGEGPNPWERVEFEVRLIS